MRFVAAFFGEQGHGEHGRYAVVGDLAAVLYASVVKVQGILLIRFEGLVVPDGHILDPREIDLLSTGGAGENEKDQYGKNLPHYPFWVFSFSYHIYHLASETIPR
jgi:hypothetical protein